MNKRFIKSAGNFEKHQEIMNETEENLFEAVRLLAI